MANRKISSQFIYTLFCAFTGVVISVIIWSFLKLMQLGMGFIWGWVPENTNIPFYTVIVCVVGGLFIGILQSKIGPYPDELATVIAKVKRDKFYPYNNVLVICLAALLPLLFGGSVGPEAGLTGVIVGLCYWAGNHMKFAKKKIPELLQIGVSTTLGVIFGAPLFGLVAPIEERTDNERELAIPRGSKIVSNIVAILAALGTFITLTTFFGGGLDMPKIEAAEITSAERIFGVPIALIGVLFGYFYLVAEKLTKAFFTRFQSKFNIILSATLGGLILGIIGTYLPITMFSGEHEITELSGTYKEFAPWLFIVIGAVKLLLTNVCIKSGWRGGHFFPLIFGGISIGYGVALITGLNPAFCLGVVTAGLLGVTMRKPVAASLLLMLCFNIRIIPWLIIAAFIGSIVPIGRLKKKHNQKEAE